MKAKFVCVSKTGKETFTVNLEPVENKDHCEICNDTFKVLQTNGTFEEERVGDRDLFCPKDGGKFVSGDRSFFKDTPHASIFMAVLSPEAGALFEEGKEVTIDFGG